MIRAEAYSEHHIDTLKKRAGIYDDYAIMKRNIKSTIESGNGNAISLVDGNTVLAVLGYTMLHAGVAEFWSITSEDIRKKPIEFHKLVKMLIASFFIDLNLHRAQFMVRDTFKAGKRWAESLGFIPEGFLNKFGPDKADYVLFVKIGESA